MAAVLLLTSHPAPACFYMLPCHCCPLPLPAPATRPTRLLLLAMDGVAPTAKMNQQVRRRPRGMADGSQALLSSCITCHCGHLTIIQWKL